MYMHIGYVPRERPPFSALNFRSGTYHFHKCQNIPLRSITILHSWPFRRPQFLKFLYVLAHGRLTQKSSRSSFRSPAFSRSSSLHLLQSPAFFTLPRHSGVCGRPECQPEASYSQFRRPAFSRSSSLSSLRSPAYSVTLELGPEPPIFHFAKFW